ncbi:MAG: hypothetical protein WCJ49_00350 [Deltaproteobacteria bacterium]
MKITYGLIHRTSMVKSITPIIMFSGKEVSTQLQGKYLMNKINGITLICQEYNSETEQRLIN